MTIFNSVDNKQYTVLTLQLFINLSGSCRDLALEYLPFQLIFQIITTEISDKIKYYAARYIHNCCRDKLDIQTGIDLMCNFGQIWTLLPLPAICELNYSLKHLSEYLLVQWYQSMKKFNLIEHVYSCLVLDYPDLAISAFHIIFQLIEYGFPFEIDCEYFANLLQSSDVLNVRMACWAIENLIRSDTKITQMAKIFMDNNIIQLIFEVFKSSPFECRQSAAYVLSEFAKVGLIEYMDFFIETDFIQEFLDFFSVISDNGLKVRMVKALNTIFDKASHNNKLEIIKDQFLENDGVAIFEELADDVDDEKHKLSNQAMKFLNSYIYEE